MPPTTPQRTAAATAVGLIALLLVGCVPIGGNASESKPAPVDGVPDELHDLYQQTLTWTDCEGEMQCATAQAPLNWDDPAGERIDLALVRQPATGGSPRGSLFVNPGGPGASGYDFVADSIDYAVGKPLQEEFDVIGFDPRGVQHSTPVTCLSPKKMDEYLFGVAQNKTGTDAWIQEIRDSAQDFGAACAESTGDLLGAVDTLSAARDLDMLRALVGDTRLNYLGFSYGTFLGAHYAELFPERVGRLVLDGAIDPSVSVDEVVLDQTVGFEKAMRAYVTNCLTSSECPLSGTVDEAMASVASLLDAVDARPMEAVDGRMLTSSTLLTAIIYPLYSQDSWTYLSQMLKITLAGDPSLAFTLADLYYGRAEDGTYDDNSFEAFYAINCLDYEYVDDVELMRAEAATLAEAAPTFGRFQGYGSIGCAEWPHDSVTPREEIHATGADPILVVGTTGDPATPYQWAVSLADQLDEGVLVSYTGEGHTAYGSSNECVSDAVEDYFIDGKVPATDPRC
ncbi:alpha/beta hydrolase [Klugiella xanthotipulae]|uniref:Alpha/beta hydrolase family protein n=1 Tax=Klugiella xanthotipulae TaxID=244735 RepID=A0A543HZ27_9MICO|nr:alpha/beta hydrolase [Klugiella xanthotipulae]TQM63568.1 alpha/beta hydrolase family protein [Klugiella xanthotipulae]